MDILVILGIVVISAAVSCSVAVFTVCLLMGAKRGALLSGEDARQ
jgi:hypothetical protein